MVGASGSGGIYTGVPPVPSPADSRINTTAPACSYHTSHLCLWRWNRQEVPKRRHL